jgi:hypothetical protein
MSVSDLAKSVAKERVFVTDLMKSVTDLTKSVTDRRMSVR